VPITLVAVFALAAFISAGLLLTANNGVTQAQGLPSATTGPAPDDKDCEVVLVTDTDAQVADQNIVAVTASTVQGGGCEVSGDSVDVEFLNYNDETDQEPSVVLYVTGGDEYSNVQAMGMGPTATEVGPLGARGVDEHAFTVKKRSDDAFDRPTPGSESITVTRDMAKGGEVYLFLYEPSDTNFATEQIGMPLSLVTEPQSKWPQAVTNAVYNDAETKVATAITGANAAFASARDASDGLDPEFQNTASGTRATYLIDVTPLTSAQEDDTALADEQGKLRTATAGLNRIKAHADYGTDSVAAVGDTPRVVGTETLEGLVEDAEEAIDTAQAAIDGAEDSDPRHFFNMSTAKLAVKVVFRDTAAAAKLVGGAYDPGHENGTAGSTLFVGRAGSSAVDEEEAPDDLTATAEKANVTVRIRDSEGIYLKGFVDLSIDTSAEGAADAVFTASARSTYYVELGSGMNPDGMVTAEIKDLPKNDPLRIPVTASFNNGEVELMAYIVRKGDATMVEAAAYACEADSDDGEDGVCASEIVALGTSNTSDDPNEVVALGPGDSFVISGKATDTVGNTVSSKGQLTWKITPGGDNEDDAEDSLEESSGNGLEMITVTSDDDAVAGTYSLTVTSGDGEASMNIMVTVSDEASMISVTCDPVIIPTDSGFTDCTVMVTDAKGNIPSNLHEEEDEDGNGRDTVRVIVRSADVSISGVDDSDDAELDDEGMATFSVVLREDAPEGKITVFVSADIEGKMLRTSTTVTYGDPSTEPGTIDPGTMDELAAPTGVVVSLLQDTISVTWTKDPNAEQTKVVVFNADVTSIEYIETVNAANDDGSHTFTDVASGTYKVTVASFRTGESHELSPLQEVTVE
jgi:hypothetical protein